MNLLDPRRNTGAVANLRNRCGKLLNVANRKVKTSGQPNEDAIVDRIFEAVIEQRLPPGTKLSEAALCEAFGVGRMRVRRSLLLLASREIVDLQSNRGAYVSSPTPVQAREVFEARRSIEPSVARIAVGRARKSDIEALERHLGQEREAHGRGDRRQAIGLSGEFHVELSKIADNMIMARMIKELVTRTSLILGMFGSPGTSSCPEDEHQQILQAFKEKKPDAVARLMHAHLEHIKANIDLTASSSRNVDLVELFTSR